MEENGVVIIEENSSTKAKTNGFRWESFWAWASIALSVAIPVVGIGVGILALSMITEDSKEDVSIVSVIGIGIGAFFAILDLMLNFLSLF